MRLSIFFHSTRLYASTECLHHPLQTITNTKYWNAKIKNSWVSLRALWVVHTLRATRKNDPLGSDLTDSFGADIVTNNFALNVGFANSPSNQLGILGAEVEHQYLFVG